MRKKVVSLLTVMALAIATLAGCASSTDTNATTGTEAATEATDEAAADDAAVEETADAEEATEDAAQVTGVKAGFIFLHDENSTYDLNFLNAAKEACEKLGIEYLIKTNIPEGQECYDAACELADAGCNFIFADSFGHEDYVIEAAKEYPDVQFSHATGTKAHTENLSNFHNAFASIYDGRYLAGIVAGMKLNEMIDNGDITADQAKMGYVGAFTYAEVISGFTSFYLGAKSQCPSATMEVQYTNSWADMSGEAEVAAKLIDDGCVLISQHADTTGAPTACETAGVPCVGYNIDMTSVAPNEALTSASMDWGVYYTYAVQCMLDGTAIDTDWCKGFSEGADKITPLNEKVVAEGTDEKVKEVEDALADGSLHVFDTSTFTVDGKELTTYKKDGSDTEYISDGYFHESEYGSAPAFDIAIDGITSITE